jgi:hypothetical protein
MLKNGIKTAEDLKICQDQQDNITKNMLPCDWCKKMFNVSKYQKSKKKKGRNIFCSKQCHRQGISKRQSGNNNSFFGKTHTDQVINNIKKANFKTGKSIVNGYVIINPVRGKSKATKEHRSIMEQHLGRKLLSKEHVHHIDGNKLNNDISNLLLTSPKEHTIIHNNKPNKKWRSQKNKEIICNNCGIKKTIKNWMKQKYCSRKCYDLIRRN